MFWVMGQHAQPIITQGSIFCLIDKFVFFSDHFALVPLKRNPTTGTRKQ